MAVLLTLLLFFFSTVVFGQTSDCPGYEATNVLDGDSYLIADLSLIGKCNTRLHVLISDADNHVFQVQEQVLPRPKSHNSTSGNTELKFNLTRNPFSFSVTRASTGDVLFDTSGAALIFESQYLRLRTSLPQNPNIYGLGEHSDDFRLPTNGYTRTLWNAESPMIPTHFNLYGAHPVYFDHRTSGFTHGVFLLSSSGMDIRLDQTDAGQNYLEYNTIGGVFDFYFLAGPEPVAVSKQYAEVVGLPAFVPYWTLGFHQCKYGWPDIDHVNQVIANYSAVDVPLETMWGDIDYMQDHRDFSLDPSRYPLDKVRAMVSSLHNNQQHYMHILDPGIRNLDSYATYKRGAEKGAFLRADDGSFYRGRQWPGEVVWPDWFAPGTQDWWTSEIRNFYDSSSGVDVDGLWVDMNEASNMCDTNCVKSSSSSDSYIQTWTSREDIVAPKKRHDSADPFLGLPNRDLFNPVYRIANHHGDISAFTLFTNVSNADSTKQYDTHNMYGTMMAAATRNALLSRNPNKRPFVLTRSTFSGAGRVAAHWFGDNASTWDHYRTAIRQMLSFTALHGMPFVGSDVCGFNGIAQEKMCARWAWLGAFQPFYRNHADISAPDQEFYRWQSVADAARRAIDVRYRLLDYMYTSQWRASVDGTPVASPLWFKYPRDQNTFGIQTQWFLGDALLVSPVVDDDSDSVNFYMPDDVFYDFWTLEKNKYSGMMHRADNVPLDTIPLHIRGGTILPMRVKSAKTTAEVRNQNFTLIVAPGRDGTAKGELFLDDGISLDSEGRCSEIMFTWDGKALEANGTFGFDTSVVVESVLVLGGDNGTREEKGPWGLMGAFGFHL
ncbi:putative alpha/beta-glucosidase agdC [Podospora australis]|uniref:alpha-glucosidase n=1 Tax=Podospora australis TaxID=1536484 RepID=A0AAN6WU95_9PEZI|nr:putative alpha/beta-glucosidase agdC [Podospora australis]